MSTIYFFTIYLDQANVLTVCSKKYYTSLSNLIYDLALIYDTGNFNRYKKIIFNRNNITFKYNNISNYNLRDKEMPFTPSDIYSDDFEISKDDVWIPSEHSLSKLKPKSSGHWALTTENSRLGYNHNICQINKY